jgi:uncharacterized protein DUF3375
VSFQGLLAKNKRLHQESTTWRLLRATSAPLVLAFLDDVFTDISEISVNEAEVLLEAELRHLRDTGKWTAETPASALLKSWTDSGWLRELDNNLSKTDALDTAIRFAHGLDNRSVGTSASHLRIVQESVRDFALATSPNVEDRLAILATKKEEIEREIAALESGEVEQLTDLQQRERIREIFQLAYVLPSDFRLVEDKIRQLDHDLRVKMIQDDATHGDVLRYMMDQEDLLAETEAGGAFKGFYTLLCDNNRNMELRGHIKDILSKPAAHYLRPFEKQFLSKLMRELTKESARVFTVRKRTEEALRAYVESGSAAENKAVNKLLGEIERLAVELKEHGVKTDSPTSLSLTTGPIKVTSPHAIKPRMPTEKIDVSAITTAINNTSPSQSMMDALDAVSVKEVAFNMERTLNRHGPMTVKQLSEYSPIQKGLEELVAHLRVAHAVKATELPEKEEVFIQDKKGNMLKASIPSYVMSAELFPDDLNDLAI